MNAGLGDVSK